MDSCICLSPYTSGDYEGFYKSIQPGRVFTLNPTFSGECNSNQSDEVYACFPLASDPEEEEVFCDRFQIDCFFPPRSPGPFYRGVAGDELSLEICEIEFYVNYSDGVYNEECILEEAGGEVTMLSCVMPGGDAWNIQKAVPLTIRRVSEN